MIIGATVLILIAKEFIDKDKRETNTRSQNIAYSAVFAALIVLLSTMMRQIAFPPVIPGVLDAAFILLIIVAVASIACGFWVGLATAFTFGLMSFITSFTNPTALAPVFNNPLVSVLPRICMGFTIYFAYRLMNKLLKDKGNKGDKVKSYVRIGVAAGVGALTNTALVLGSMALIYGGRVIGGTALTAEFFTWILTFVGSLEFVATALLTPPIVYAIGRATRRSL